MNSYEDVKTVFDELRELGYLAEFNFMCCSNCASTAITDRAVDLIDEGRKPEDILGCVFCHEQDIESAEKTGTLHIRYGSMDSTAYGEIGKHSQSVGDEVSELFKQHGFVVEWNGDHSKTIQLHNIRKGEHDV